MVFVLSKVLLFLIKPIFWVCCLLIFSLISKKPIRRKRFLITGLITLLFFSNPFLINIVFNAYEAPYPIDQKYDVGIVLGGFSGINQKNNDIEFNSSNDRLMQALSLYQKGKIRKILISSGSANLVNNTIKEADLVRDYLIEIGIPDTSILIENQSRNTIENAKFSKDLLNKIEPKAKVLVITSAWHIPRAHLNFAKFFKNKVDYYPTDYVGRGKLNFLDAVIPSSSALSNWELIIKEWVGLVIDRFRS